MTCLTWFQFFIRGVSVYASGSNLLTLSGNRKIMEMNVAVHPPTDLYNLGKMSSSKNINNENEISNQSLVSAATSRRDDLFVPANENIRGLTSMYEEPSTQGVFLPTLTSCCLIHRHPTVM